MPPGQRLTPSGALEIDTDDGGVIIDFEPHIRNEAADDDFDQNLAKILNAGELSRIASDLIRGIEQDDRSRSDWMQTRARGIDTLGLKLEMPRSDFSSSAAPLEGMSTVRHPLLLEACLRGQANARAELLPAAGPVKTKNIGQGTAENDDQAEQLEDFFNHYITDVASEYYPGCGFKKLYHCPLRQRPVSESVDPEDLIVANTATDLQNANRVTQVIKMSKSVLIRMQLAGAYRDVALTQPDESINAVDRKVAKVEGIDKLGNAPEDIDHTLYECYCNLDIPGFEHEQDDKITGLPLPYKVVIDKTSRQVLEIRRNWQEGDETCTKRRNFVMYPFVPMFGFYPCGLLNILGNTANAVTAAWRVLLDAGMFGNFPGWLYAKQGNRQVNNSFRVAPGSGVPVDIGGGADIRASIIPLPYKTPDPASMQLVENIASTGQRLGGTAEAAVSEGNQEAPVGTTLALIEQAGKIISGVHKRLHAAQAEEFQIWKELFREDPEALWRHRRDKVQWNAEALIAALENYDIVPCADPNTPSHMHRLMKAEAFRQTVAMAPGMFNLPKSTIHYLHEIGVADPEQFLAPPSPPGAAEPDPNAIKAQTAHETNQVKLMDIQTRAATEQQKLQSDEHLEKLRIAERLAVHPMSQGIIENENPGTGQ